MSFVFPLLNAVNIPCLESRWEKLVERQKGYAVDWCQLQIRYYFRYDQFILLALQLEYCMHEVLPENGVRAG